MARGPSGNGPNSQSIVSRRHFVTSVGAAGTAVTLAGCVGGDDDPSDDTADDVDDGVDDGDEEEPEGEWPDFSGEEIYYLAESSDREYQEFWQRVANRFQEATGAQVTIEFAGHAEGYRDRLIQMVQAGDPPDVTHASLNMASSLGQQGQLADHTEVLEYWEDVWGESFDDQFRILLDGEDKYLPLHANIFGNWYRDDVFDVEPNSWERELEMAAEHDEGPGGTRGYFMPIRVGLWANDMQLLTNGWTLGAQVFDRDDDGELQVVLDQEGHAELWSEALDHMEELYEYSDDNLDAFYSELFTALGTESAYQAHWVGTHLKIFSIDSPVAEHITETDPAVPEGMDRRQWGNIQGQAVTSDGNTEVGLEFLKFLAHPENVMGYYFAEDLQQDPILTSVAEHELFAQHWEEMKEGTPWRDSDLKYHRLEESEFVDWGTEVDPVNPRAFEVNVSHPMGRVVNQALAEGRDHQEVLEEIAEDLRADHLEA